VRWPSRGRTRSSSTSADPGAEIVRVETDSDGVYEAHIVTTDDQELTVALDEDFAITGMETGR